MRHHHRPNRSYRHSHRQRFGSPLLRRPRDGWLGGICAAIAHRFHLPLLPLRIGVAIAALVFTTPVVVLYLAAWLFLDSEDEHWERRCEDARPY